MFQTGTLNLLFVVITQGTIEQINMTFLNYLCCNDGSGNSQEFFYVIALFINKTHVSSYVSLVYLSSKYCTNDEIRSLNTIREIAYCNTYYYTSVKMFPI